MKFPEEIQILTEETLNSQLTDHNILLPTVPDFKIRPPYLHGELENLIHKYPTNGLAGLL